MKEKLKDLVEKMLVLRDSPRELWIVYLVNITEYVAYTLMQFSLVLWMMTDMGLSDTNASWTLGIWSMSLSALMSVSGMVTDGLGIKRSLWLGYAISAVGRLAIAFQIPFVAAVLVGLSPIAVGMALMVPVSTAAIRRYSTPEGRSMAFSLFYVLFNVGYAIGGKAWDVLRAQVKAAGGSVRVQSVVMSDHQFNFFISAVVTVAGVLLIWFLIRRGIQARQKPLTEPGQAPEAPEPPQPEPEEKTQEKEIENPVRIFLEVVREKKFWVFMFFMLILVGAKSVFYHMHYTLPPFAERYIGEGAKIGTAWGALNPLLIVLIVPFIGAWTQKISSFKMVVIGTFISAVSSFILCLPGEWFRGVTEIGWLIGPIKWFLGIAPSQPFHPWYIPLILFVFVFTIGEGIWSPRVMEYTASIAPKDRVGSYMSLSVLPWFASKPLVAAIMAWILPSFAPAEGTIHPTSFWLVIAISALSTPVLIFFFQKMIRSTTESDLDEDTDTREKDNLPDYAKEAEEKKDTEPPAEGEEKGEGSAK